MILTLILRLIILLTYITSANVTSGVFLSTSFMLMSLQMRYYKTEHTWNLSVWIGTSIFSSVMDVFKVNSLGHLQKAVLRRRAPMRTLSFLRATLLWINLARGR